MNGQETKKNGGRETAKSSQASAVQKEGETNQPTNTRHSNTTASGYKYRLGMSTVTEQQVDRMVNYVYRPVPVLLRLNGHFEVEYSAIARARQRKGDLRAPLPGPVCLALPRIASLCDVTAWPQLQALLVMIQCLKAKESNCNHGPDERRACNRQEFGPKFNWYERIKRSVSACGCKRWENE